MLLIVEEQTGVNVMLDISNFPWAEFNLVENRDLYVADSLGLKRSKRTTGIHRFEFELVTVEMPDDEGRALKAKLSRAVNDVLHYRHPRYSYSNGTVPGSGILVSGSHAKGATSVTLTSLNIWQLKAGDYLQWANDSKVYEVAEDTGKVSGVQTVQLTFPLRTALTASSTVTANGITWYLSSDGIIAVDTQANQNQDMQITLSVVEQL